jgi:hypothetical protein
MKALLACTFFLWQAGTASEPPVARPDAMRYERAVHVPAATGQACAVLDGQVFSHAAASLADMRIFAAGQGNEAAHEVPYAVTESEAATEETQAARLLNLGEADGKIVFDLEMPQRAYTDVRLELDPAVENFVASAAVIGTNVLGTYGSRDKSVDLGTFTLFDLAAQHLSRNTTLPLEESTFRYLHVVMSVAHAPGAGYEGTAGSAAKFAPGMVEGAEVPPSREAQILYTTVAETSSLARVGGESRAVFELPARVPVERIAFVLAPGFTGNFSRTVRVTALADSSNQSGGDDRAPMPEVMTGTILRLHANEAGREIRSDELDVPAILGANLQRAAKVEVAIENGEDQPVPIAAVRLEMRQREVCFDAAAAAAAKGELALYYGDPKLEGPAYDYEQMFRVSEKAGVAQLGPEMLNPAYRAPKQAAQTFAELHPDMLWIALLAAICTLGMVAVKTSRSVEG